HATERGGDANRATDIAADLEGREPGGKRGGPSARTAPWRPRQVPGVVTAAVDNVVSLPIRQHWGDVRFAEQDGTGGLSTLCGGSVNLAARLTPIGNTDSGRQSTHVDRLFECDRQPEEWTLVAVRPHRIRCLSLAPGALKARHHDGVELGVITF